MSKQLTPADRARITIACARNVLTQAAGVSPVDPVATARVMGQLQATVEQLLELVEAGQIHRYDCTVHDGDGCDGHCLVTPQLFLSWYADDITPVSEQPAATTLTELAAQLGCAAGHLTDAGINQADDWETAATLVSSAADATGLDQHSLLKRASSLLYGHTDAVDEYRDMT